MHWKLPLQYEPVEEQTSLLQKADALAVEVAKIKAHPPFMPSVCPGQSWLFPLPLLTPNSLPSGTSSTQH